MGNMARNWACFLALGLRCRFGVALRRGFGVERDGLV